MSTKVPAYANSLNTPLMYDITSAPDANTGGRTYPVYVGNVVGGGSVVNGMAFDRASAADYDAWELLGNLGWNWNSMLYYFKKSTTFTPPSAENVRDFGITYDASYYGTNGPVQASFPNFEYPDVKTMFGAYKAAGVPLPKEQGGGLAVGAYWVPTSLQPGTQTRSDARTSYWEPVKSRKNLILATGRTVNEILFDQGVFTGLKAKGVQYVSRADKSVKQVFAKQEVILAAGAVFTPQLLQLSGIGPSNVLKAAGVTVKRNMPGVGANMQDHPNVNMMFDLKNMATPNPLSGMDPTFNTAAFAQYQTNNTGPITQAHGSTLAFLSLQTITQKYTDIVSSLLAQTVGTLLPSLYSDSALLRGFLKQRSIISALHARPDVAIAEFPIVAFGLSIGALQRPLSRGTITLNPSNKYGSPVVQFNTFQNPIDKKIMVEIVRWIRQHWKRPELAKFEPVEMVPGADAQTDDDIIDALIAQKALLPTFAHMSGTCSMMPELLGGVVASDLTVYNVRGLSIVDASIIPLIPATHLQATMYAVAEKAADIIKNRGSGSFFPSMFKFFFH
jgi:choline dehydrogenase-like flavoprotein